MSSIGIKAVYQDTGIHDYKNNPFIEALPPIQDPMTFAYSLRSANRFIQEDKLKAKHIRTHNIARLMDNFFQPMGVHLLLIERVSLMIRGGYVGRNPKTGDYQRHLQNGYERLNTGKLSDFRFENARSTAQSLLLIGCSGSGKTTSLQRILANYPQVIYHPDWNIHQVVYLKIDCSHNGSLKEICLNFFRALDKALATDYERRYVMKRHSIETLLATMSQIANSHALGLLVIDEIQHLSRSRSGGSQEMLNFFVTMVNTIGVPVMLIGTPKAREIFEADLRSARRGAGLGAIFWDPLPYKIKGKINPEWIAFTNNLWKWQLLQNQDLEPSTEISELWYDLSQGVMDIVVKLFVLAQLRALSLNKERITPGLLKQVYEDELKPVHPMLAALRSGIPEKIARYSDLMLPHIEKRIVDLQHQIALNSMKTPEEKLFEQLNSEMERRFYLQLQDDYDPALLIETIRSVCNEHISLSRQQLLRLIINALAAEDEQSKVLCHENDTTSIKTKKTSVEWDSLDLDDLRYIYSQHPQVTDFYQQLKQNGEVFDLMGFMRKVG